MDNNTGPPKASSSSSSSSNTDYHAAKETPLPDAHQTILYTDDPEVANPQLRRPWYRRISRNLASKLPRTARVVRYLRGPRPKVDLPDPKPFLDIKIHFRSIHIVLPLETTVLRLTRPFTYPLFFALFAVAWIIGFSLFTRAQSFITPPEDFIDCTSTFWLDKAGCGLNGESCAPFNATLPFNYRCPAQCSGLILQNPRTIGDEQIAFVPLIVGGGDGQATYRGDSFICAAAVQQGLISNSRGGCISLDLIGEFSNFLPFTGHGLSSIGFPTVFPVSYRLGKSSLTNCNDNRDFALLMNVFLTCIMWVIFRPKPIVKFWCLVCLGFWHIVVFSQPSGSPPDLETAFGTFLPTLFIAYGIWRVGYRFVLPAFSQAPLESMVWYLGPYWVGVLNNMTIDQIPISRLLGSDIAKRPGAVTSLVILILVITVLVINQLRVIRKTGWLPHYFAWYALGGLITLILSQLPGLVLRIHHYIIALVFMPGTAFPTRISAIVQGLLLGLFLNGGAAFGFDSILQTPASLQRDAPIGSDLPTFETNSSTYNPQTPISNQSITWAALPEGWDGFSLLVDDVERYVGTDLNFSLASLSASLPHFFRLALTSNGNVGDYTMAATLWPNGTWVNPLPGPS